MLTNINLRLTEQTKAEAKQYADALGVSTNAALNVLIREGLHAVAGRHLDSTLKKISTAVQGNEFLENVEFGDE